MIKIQGGIIIEIDKKIKIQGDIILYKDNKKKSLKSWEVSFYIMIKA